MSFQPRYSLLTLLALTAVVAVVVKLWYGPHHVIERPSPNLEDEYTYTRDWTGSKTVHGPRLLRYYHPDGELEKTVVLYYRDGLNTENERVLYAEKEIEGYGFQTSNPISELNAAEKAEYENVVAMERERIKKLGFIVWEPKYADPIFIY